MKTELVTTLKRKASEILGDLAVDRNPILITQHGRPAAYLVDVDTFERMGERLAVIEVIARGERAIEEGRVLSHAAAKRKMSRWLR